jgi:uncharacterized repeat protein (TIGR01451 family)
VNARLRNLWLALSAGALLLIGVWTLLSFDEPAVALAQPSASVIRVATSGTDAIGCGSVIITPCLTVQYAVDQAADGDEIRVAAGLYTDVYTRNLSGSVFTQTVFISTSVSVRGGYTTTNWITPDPAANPTILDAQGLGRVIYITREVTVTLDGLRIVNGAGDMGGDGSPLGSGGGIFGDGRALTVSNCTLMSNTAHSDTPSSVSQGGGIYQGCGSVGGYCSYTPILVVENSRIVSNAADYNGGGIYVQGTAVLQNVEVVGNRSGESGSGVCSYYSSLSIRHSDFSDNTAQDDDPYDINSGGGVYAYGGDAVILDGNTFVGNTALGFAGGVYVRETTLTMTDNLVQDNVSQSSGGGANVYDCVAYLAHNTFEHNTAASAGGGLEVTWGDLTLTHNRFLSNTGGTYGGGGLYGGGIAAGHAYTVTHNLFQGNVGSWAGSCVGGGVRMFNGSVGDYGWIVFSHNQVLSNTASAGQTGANGGRGGGASIAGPALIADNLFQGNWASNAPPQGGYYYGGYGGGLDLMGPGLRVEGNRILENRAARNAGVNYTAEAFGGGVYIAPSAIVTMTNNIVVGNRHCEECLVLSGMYRGGGGIYIGGQTTPTDTQLYLYHNTIADNQSPALMSESGAIAMSHNIFSGHATDLKTIQDTSGLEPPPTTAADYTLWYPAMSVEIVAGTFTHAHDFTGAPDFVSTPLDSYHLGPASQALDKGPGVGVTGDIDGDPRPIGAGYDLGADERTDVHLSSSSKYATPQDAAAGQVITYNIVLRNSGTSTATNTTLFDAIPLSTTYVPGSAWASSGVVTYTGGISWTGSVAPGAPVVITFRVTANQGVLITNTATVTDTYGITTSLTAWVNAKRIYLPVVLRASSQ